MHAHVRALTSPPFSPLVRWCAGAVQAHPENMEQAKRVITRCSELGIKHILWSARDSAVSNPINSTDSWDWGASLWLNVGEHIGAGRWFPSKKGAALPPTTRALVDYAAQHGVHLCPYIYPSDGMRYTPDGELAPWVFQTGAARGACPLPACHMSLPSPTPCAQCYNQLVSTAHRTHQLCAQVRQACYHGGGKVALLVVLASVLW